MKTPLKLLLVVLLPLALGACDALQVDDRKFDDDPKIEFQPLTQSADEGDGTLTTTVQLIGPQRDSDLQVSFTVADSSTAESGTHYSLGSTTATIQANSSEAEVDIQVLDNGLDDGGEVVQLFLNLQDSQGVEAAENLDAYTLVIEGADE